MGLSRLEACQSSSTSVCHAHHDVPWSRAGGTSVERGRLLCPMHHRLVHDAAFQHSLDKHGQVLFSRRT